MSLASDPQGYVAVDLETTKDHIPRISYNPRDDKKGIFAMWVILLTAGFILPLTLLSNLLVDAKLGMPKSLAITSGTCAAIGVWLLARRTWRLIKKESTCRALGAGRWSMDYSNFNFFISFVFVAAFFIVGSLLQNIRIFSLGLPVLVTQLCAQILLFAVLSQMRVKLPFRVSSTSKGEYVRSGVYTLVEDTIAVDAGQGQTYRRELMARYNASIAVRRLCRDMDWYWGVTGTLFGVSNIFLVLRLSDDSTAFILAWSLPWAYSIVMTAFTIVVSKAYLSKELSEKIYVDGADDDTRQNVRPAYELSTSQ